MKKYTLGFIFDKNLQKILLIEKARPDWQAGKMNGIGGKIEAGENSLSCIVREVKEECGLLTNHEDWLHVGNISGQDWKVDIFGLVYKGDPADAKTMGDEEVRWCEIHAMPENILNNLTWLVPLTLDKIKYCEFHTISVNYI